MRHDPDAGGFSADGRILAFNSSIPDLPTALLVHQDGRKQLALVDVQGKSIHSF